MSATGFARRAPPTSERTCRTPPGVTSTCNVCTRFCPGDAIGSEKHEVNGIVRWLVDTEACEPYFYELYGCKICLMVCPFNNQSAQREHYAPVIQDIVAVKDAAGLLELIKKRTQMESSHVDFTVAIKDES